MNLIKEFIINKDIHFREKAMEAYELVMKLREQYPTAVFYVCAEHECDEAEDEYGNYVVEEVNGPLVLFSQGKSSMIVRHNPFRDKWDTEGYEGGWSQYNMGVIINESEMNEEAMHEGDYLWIQGWEVKNITMEYKPKNNKEAAQLLERYDR